MENVSEKKSGGYSVDDTMKPGTAGARCHRLKHPNYNARGRARHRTLRDTTCAESSLHRGPHLSFVSSLSLGSRGANTAHLMHAAVDVRYQVPGILLVFVVPGADANAPAATEMV